MLKLGKIFLGFIFILFLIFSYSFLSKKDISSDQINILSIEDMSSIFGGTGDPDCPTQYCHVSDCGNCVKGSRTGGKWFIKTQNCYPKTPFNDPEGTQWCCKGKFYDDSACTENEMIGPIPVDGCIP